MPPTPPSSASEPDTDDETPAAADLLLRATHVVFDFDGPVCSLFATGENGTGSVAPVIARDFRQRLGKDHSQVLKMLDTEGVSKEDPHALYQALVRLHRRSGNDETHELVDNMRAWLDEAEEKAVVDNAFPTPGAHQLLNVLHERGYQLAIASNNSEAAIRSYLVRHELDGFFREGLVRGRPREAWLMKPHPHTPALVRAIWDTAPSSASHHYVMIGDSVADVKASSAQGVRFGFIGYHRTAKQLALLRKESGAKAPMVTDLVRLTDEIVAQPSRVRLTA
ncbi:Phosphoglycolate phosphatase [Streptomyces sp. RB5]|uniref:Phosphoglycolate phosphatase n=1 Tax=Streptomyces smaragdinus TaxID=2585196 RepID=A0A7K0CS40_9ACTN|nr:Phosphoglycolate phosphatase [Streptomyces smaragdinus]